MPQIVTIGGDQGINVVGGIQMSTFLLLTDTPNDYSGEALKIVRVNAGETGLEFVPGTLSPPGSDTQVLFNDGGAYGAVAGVTLDKVAGALTANRFRVDPSYYLDLYGGNPEIFFDAFDQIIYDRTANELQVLIDGAPTTFGKTHVTLSPADPGGGYVTKELRFQEIGSTKYSAFKAPATYGSAGNFTYTLPTNLPSLTGRVLASTTSGLLSWADPAAFISAGINQVLFKNSAGSYVGHSGLTYDSTTGALDVATSVATASTITPLIGTASNAALAFRTNSVTRISISADGTGAYIAPYGAGAGETMPLRFSALNGTNYVGIKAPDTVTNIDYVLPAVSPTNGQLLSSTSAGVLSWVTAGSAYGTVQDEGTPLTQRTVLNFTGAGVTASDSGGITVIDIPGGGGGGGGSYTATWGEDIPAGVPIYFADDGGTAKIYKASSAPGGQLSGGSGSSNTAAYSGTVTNFRLFKLNSTKVLGVATTASNIQYAFGTMSGGSISWGSVTTDGFALASQSFLNKGIYYHAASGMLFINQANLSSFTSTQIRTAHVNVGASTVGSFATITTPTVDLNGTYNASAIIPTSDPTKVVHLYIPPSPASPNTTIRYAYIDVSNPASPVYGSDAQLTTVQTPNRIQNEGMSVLPLSSDKTVLLLEGANPNALVIHQIITTTPGSNSASTGNPFTYQTGNGFDSFTAVMCALSSPSRFVTIFNNDGTATVNITIFSVDGSNNITADGSPLNLGVSNNAWQLTAEHVGGDQICLVSRLTAAALQARLYNCTAATPVAVGGGYTTISATDPAQNVFYRIAPMVTAGGIAFSHTTLGQVDVKLYTPGAAAYVTGSTNETKTAGQTGSVALNGMVGTGFSGLSVGQQYYITTDGTGITLSSASGTRVGMSLSTTELSWAIQR